MKDSIHPVYQDVIMQDLSSSFSFLTRSTRGSNETMKWVDGKEYPVIKVEISSASHPFYTGQQKLIDTAGRIERFTRRYATGTKK
jgi:large subunit ribosomal protein L31